MKCLIKYQDKEIRMEGIGRFIAKKVIFFYSKRLAKTRTVPAVGNVTVRVPYLYIVRYRLP
jgi:hypothetical protein